MTYDLVEKARAVDCTGTVGGSSAEGYMQVNQPSKQGAPLEGAFFLFLCTSLYMVGINWR